MHHNQNLSLCDHRIWESGFNLMPSVGLMTLLDSEDFRTSVSWDDRSDFRIMYVFMPNQMFMCNSYRFLSEYFLKYLLC